MSPSTPLAVGMLLAAADEDTYTLREFVGGAGLIGVVALALLILLIVWLVRRL